MNFDNEDMVTKTTISKVLPPKKVKTSEVKRVKKIPTAFIDHIRSLGFTETDADVLYENKDDWMGMSTGWLKIFIFVNTLEPKANLFKESKVCCTSNKCTFETYSSLNCLVEHCKTAHKWTEIPCSFDNCHFVAYNSQSYQAHLSKFHTTHRTYVSHAFPCTWKNCNSGFTDASKLDRHMKIHTNDLIQCVFCPYRTTQYVILKHHYRFHFNMYDSKCDYCDKKFVTQAHLNFHVNDLHSNEGNLTCHICKTYSGSRHQLRAHIKHRHNFLTKWNEAKKAFDTFTRD